MSGANGVSAGNGIGQATYKALVGPGSTEAGAQFNCTSTICYGVGAANHQLFMNLQSALNRLAGLARFSPLRVDGKIGGATVNAAHKAAALAAKAPLFTPTQIGTIQRAVGGYTDKIELAQNAPFWYDVFRKTADFQASGAAPTRVMAQASPSQVAAQSAAQAAAQGAVATTAPGAMVATGAGSAGVAKLIAKCRANPNDPDCLQVRDTCNNLDLSTQSPDLQKLCKNVGGETKKKSTLMWWIAGSVAVIALAAIGYVIVRKQRGQALAGSSVRYQRRQLPDDVDSDDNGTVDANDVTDSD